MRRVLIWLSVAGVSISLALVVLAYIFSKFLISVPYWLQLIYLSLWPASILLATTEYASVRDDMAIVTIAILLNAALYAGLGIVVLSIVKAGAAFRRRVRQR
jgi:hypothetical protein